MNVLDITPVKYTDEKLLILDQTLLPGEERYIEMQTKEDVWEAIYKLRVRGAPAIGVAAGYGLYLAVRDFPEDRDPAEFQKALREASDYLVTARPTAVNLAWALERMVNRFNEASPRTVSEGKALLFEEAEAFRKEDEAACFAMGEYGLSLLKPGMGILTHCNAGTIATAKYGTCLAPIYLGAERGYNFKVFADETRPLLQGARLTSWELSKAGVDVTLICDNMASAVMKNGWIDAVVGGCGRMGGNGHRGISALFTYPRSAFRLVLVVADVQDHEPTSERIAGRMALHECRILCSGLCQRRHAIPQLHHCLYGLCSLHSGTLHRSGDAERRRRAGKGEKREEKRD